MSRQYTAWSLALSVAALALSVTAGIVFAAEHQSSKLPVYQIARTSIPIEVDGKLDDASWGSAPGVGKFVLNTDASPASSETEAKVLYDDKFLYFAFRCMDQNVWSTLTRRDEPLWKEEVVEVFLQADPRQTSYIELEVNPLGAMLDLYLLDVRKELLPQSWNSDKLRWAVQVQGTVDGNGGDREWSCEIALPIEDIVTATHRPPVEGDRWRLNLYRVEKLPVRADMAWSPTLKEDFHIPEMFGELVFTGRQVP